MTWTDNRERNDWRSCLTPAEEETMADIEAKMKSLDAKRRLLTSQRQLIQNRATTRFRARTK